MRVSATFPSRPDAPGRARRFIAETLATLGVPDADVPMLIVSELASNVVRHGGDDPFEVTLEVARSTLRIEVRDGGTARPRLREIDHETTSGRGIHIVERLTRSWGTRPEGAGKVVWVELETHP